MTQRRRVPFILLVALGMVFALATSVLAAGGNLQIKCDDVTVDLANTDTFEVNVRSTGNPSYVTGTVDVTFDDNTFDLVYIRFNPKLAPNNATYLSEDDVDLSTLSDAQLAALGSDEGTPVVTTAGKFCVDFGDDLKDANYTEAGVLFTLVFKVADKNATGEFPIGLTVLEDRYLTTDGELITNVNADDGSVKNGSSTITVNVIGKGTNIPSYKVDDHELEVTYSVPCKIGYKDASGNYIAINVEDAASEKHMYSIPMSVTEVLVVVKGDTNGDGKITLADATKTKAAFNNKIVLTAEEVFAGNVNTDDKITMADATKTKAVYNNKSSFAW